MRKGLLAAAAAAVLALLAGCTAIPQSGAVHQGEPQFVDDSIELDFLARSPEKGATREEILAGFIDAAATPQAGYAVAREFLTGSFDDAWNPDESATIDRGIDRVTATSGELSMAVVISPVAEVSAHGQYTEDASAARVTLDYEFQKVEGEWRISKAPQGILIDRPTFEQVFGSYPLYYFDPSFTYLVPDLRWFPRRVSTPTQIVRELLAGPSSWLAGAVVSAFPEGTSLTSDTVQVVARAAQVDLTSESLRAEETTLQRMRQQLSESLVSGVPAISTVTISTDQIEQEIPALPEYQAPRVDPRPLVLRGGEFGFLPASGDALVPITGISDAVAELAPTAVTLGTRRSAAAVLSGAGVSLVRAGDASVTLDTRPDLIAPAIDPAGYVWSVPADEPTEIRAFAPDGSVHRVTAPWPDATGIVALRLSRDGTRLIALLRTNGHSRFVAAGITRGDGADRQVPVQLGEPLTLATVEGEPLDAAWLGELTVVSLTLGPDEVPALVIQELGGPSTTTDAAAKSVNVVGGNTIRDLRLRTLAGSLEQRQGIGWQPRIDEVAVLATQQGL